MKKILMVGNSFSQDASAKVESMTDELFVRNLYIGGCPLEKHAELLHSDEQAYEYQKDGEMIERISLAEALKREKWDYITVQQASGFSGLIDSYYPYLTQLLAFIRERSDAEIVFHQTWAYEKTSVHEHFINYNGSQAEMQQKIEEVSLEVCTRENLRRIQDGNLFTLLRENALFDIDKGGESLHRDGFHASLDTGRTALAANLIAFFTGDFPRNLVADEAKNTLICDTIKKLNGVK